MAMMPETAPTNNSHKAALFESLTTDQLADDKENEKLRKLSKSVPIDHGQCLVLAPVAT